MNKKQHSKNNIHKKKLLGSYLKKIKIGNILIVAVICLVFVFFSIEMLTNNERLFSKFDEDNQNLLDLYIDMVDLESDVAVENQLIYNFYEDFNVQRDYYPIISKNNKMVFVMNERETEVFTTYSLSDYLMQNEINATEIEYNLDAKVFNNMRLEDNHLFSVILNSFTVDDDVYVVGICAGEDYYYENYRMWVHNRYVIASFIVTLIIVFCYTFMVNERSKKLAIENEKRRINEINTRTRLDQQTEINNKLSKTISNEKRTLYPQEFFETTIEQLTVEQKEQSVILIIEENIKSFQTNALVAALLERNSSKNIISCVGNDHSFIVLMLNSTIDAAEVFKYKLSLQLQDYTTKGIQLPNIYVSKYFENDSFERKEK